MYAECSGNPIGCKVYGSGIEQAANNYKQSKKLLWELYEEANKMNYTSFIPHIFVSMALSCIKLQNKKQAQMFFNLPKSTLLKTKIPYSLYEYNQTGSEIESNGK